MRLIFFLALFVPTSSFTQTLTNNSTISITKSWYQEPNGYTYPMNIYVPSGAVPNGGFPVCILLHGNGGQGAGILAQFQNVLDCHALIAPSGYMNSWNISEEGSDAPDVEMMEDLINNLQTYSNINPNKIRVLGFSNGSALANRVLIENSNTGVDIICGMVSQLSEANYHNGNFYSPSGQTSASLPYCGYDVVTVPITGRKYLSICNFNDPLIPYNGGPSVGVTFLDAQLATYIVAQSQGFNGSQMFGPGNDVGTSTVALEEFSYINGQVVHLKGDANHGTNPTQLNYVKDFFTVDCSSTGYQTNNDQKIMAFPNPVHASLNISVGNHISEIEFKLFDARGILLETSSATNIDLSQYANGIYFLRIFYDEKIEEIKVLKN
ncbi:MAG: hypothetical protein CL846_10035 [Crocinitomicaceae bacterium]|nr:hypothetical protein [Crocinitomicaceae bacterium]